MATKVRNCDETLIRERLKKAEQFMKVAADAREIADDEAEAGDALVSL